MPRGSKGGDIFGTIRAQAAKVLQQLERQIQSLEEELSQLRDQLDSWRKLAGGAVRSAVGRGPGRPAGSSATRRASGGGRVKWEEVLSFLPKRFGVQDVMKHPGAAAKGRAQVYPALNRWETSKRIRRVGKGVYEKTGGGGEAPVAGAKPAKRTPGRKRGAAKTKRAKVAAKPPEAKAS